jgi:hypothetical protein
VNVRKELKQAAALRGEGGLPPPDTRLGPLRLNRAVGHACYNMALHKHVDDHGWQHDGNDSG